MSELQPLNLKDAVLSECGLYRYRLSRSWGFGPKLGFLMLNPSTADAAIDDPTIRRCIAYAKAWDYGGLEVVNLFAFRATDPKDLIDSAEAGIPVVGHDNDRHIQECFGRVEGMIAAWGAHPFAQKRACQVREMLPGPLYYLRLTKDGHPGHPLYLPKDLTPTKWISVGNEQELPSSLPTEPTGPARIAGRLPSLGHERSCPTDSSHKCRQRPSSQP